MTLGISVGGMYVPTPVVDVVLRMRHEAPGLLDAFRLAVREAADQAAYEVVACPAETVQVAQGRARVYQALAALLANPEKYAELTDAAAKRRP